MKDKTLKNISLAVLILFCVVYLMKFGAQKALKIYVEMGAGDCRKIPLFCRVPALEVLKPHIDKDYLLQELIPYRFPKVELYLPRGFDVTQQTIKKIYYKRRQKLHNSAIVYVVPEPPGFFINLYPQVKRLGIANNYQFVRRVMFARLNEIKSLNEAFLVIMKGIFTPDIGDQNKAVMVEFEMPERRGFINYTISQEENFFDCNIIGAQDNYFKVYIKDKGARLDLEKVFTIIATVGQPS